ncbi:MAG: transposase [Terracidiphilus sp.]
MSTLLCLGRHTVTGLLTTCGAQFRDWTSSYRLFSHDRLPAPTLFSVVRRAVVEALPPQAPVRACLDDSLLRRSGSHTPGVAWRRDPLGPRFQTNFVRAQRFLQISLALPAPDGSCRMIPVAFRHAPTPPKPGKKATPAEQKQYRAQARAARLGQRAREEIGKLRAALDADPASASRRLILAFDGGYTNGTTLKHLPPNTTAIGRLRQDAHLLFRPDPATQKARGRRLCYGPPAPTPEQVRTDDSPWETLTLRHNGIPHQLRFKRRTGLMWRAAGARHVLQLIIIAPLAYRLRKGSKLLYRKPAFLLCTDENLDPQVVIETYVWRWDIEVNFREEKTLLGVGQAQVRDPHSVESAPALSVAAYALLLLATQRAFAHSRQPLLPRPKWIHPSPSARISTQQAIHQLRAEVWGRGLGLDNFSPFASTPPPATMPEKSSFPLASAVCYANA